MPSTNGATLPATQANHTGSDTGATSQQRGKDTDTDKREPRISTVTAGFMMVVAFVCDFFGPVGAVAGAVIFFIWFKIKGVPILSTTQIAKQAANLGLNGIAETLTAGAWVGVSVGVGITIFISRVEDRTGFKITTALALTSLGSFAKGKLSATKPSSDGAPSSTAGTTASVATGATPTQQTAPTTAPSENPVTAIEQAHYAAVNEAPVQGATPRTPAVSAPQPTRPPVLSDQDEEVAVSVRPQVDSLPSQRASAQSNEEAPVPFPGSGSASFGQSTPNSRDLNDLENAARQEGGQVLYHGGLPDGANLDTVDLERSGTQQNKRGRDYGGFYLTDESSKDWSEQYAKERSGNMHGFHIDPKARILEVTNGPIDRLSKAKRQELSGKYDVVKGRDIMGRVQYVLLNKNVVKGVSSQKINQGATPTPVHDDIS